MRQFNVVMLPTEKASRIGYPNKKGEEVYKDLRYMNIPISSRIDIDSFRPQHLYITEPDATIENGDWCVKEVLLSGFIRDEEGYLYNKTTWSNKVVVSKVICSTDPELGLPLCDDDFFIQGFIAYGKNLFITNLKVRNDNTCAISWVYRPDEVIYQNVDLSKELVKAIEHNLQVPSYENSKGKEFPQSNEQLLGGILNEAIEVVIPTTPLPKTQQEFIELLSQQVTGLSIDCIDGKKTKPNYNGIKIDFTWLCECARQFTPNEELELLNTKINKLKQFFNDPEIVSIINR